MPAKAINYRLRCGIYQHTDISHALTALFTKEATIALHEMNKQALNQALEIGGHQIDSIPGRDIHITQEEPDILTLGAIYWSHTQRVGAVIKKARVTKISYQGFR
jgi:hypothetical protein